MYRYTDFDRQFVHARAAQFRDQLQRHLAGQLGEEEFRPLRLQNGWYVQRHAPMLRIAVPYGELSSRQLRQLALIARRFDRGYGHFTTRQNLQFNWIPLHQAADVMDLLAEVDMHGIQTSGNCVRNITSDAWAGIAPDEAVDPRPYCEILRQWSTLHPEFAFLPRKFKIAVTGAAEDRAAIGWHDIGLQLLKNSAGEVGFKVLVGGGMGRTPVIGTRGVAVRAVARDPRLRRGDPARVQPLWAPRQHLQGAHQDPGQGRGRALRRGGAARVSNHPRARRRRARTPDSAGRVGPRGQPFRDSCRRARACGAGQRRRSRPGRHAVGVSALARAQRARASPERPSRGHAVAQARRAGAGRRHRRSDGPRGRTGRALQPRRTARHARPEPVAAVGAHERSARAVGSRSPGQLRHAEHRPADRHDRLPRRRLLRPRQRTLDPDRRGHHRSVSTTSICCTTSATSICTSAAASIRAATITAATSASSASTRTVPSGTR